MINRSLSRGAIVVMALVLAACSSTPATTTTPTGPAATVAPGASPTPTPDPIAALEAGARAGGAVNSYGMPNDWTNFGAIWGVFTAKYGLTHSDTDMSSAEEIQKFDAEKNNPVADMGDIGIQFGPVAITAGVADCYKPTSWDKIPDWAKDPNGCWTAWYQGTIVFAVNTTVVPNPPASWADLLKPEYKGKVAMSDPRTTGQGAMAFMAANLAMGGDESNLQPGFDYFKKLSDAGNFVATSPTSAAIEKGEAGVAILWDYNALPVRDTLAAATPATPITVVVPSDGTVSAPYVCVLNKYGAHKDAARLMEEYVLSPEGQILQSQKYARPIRTDVQLPADIAAKFPKGYEATKTIKDWVKLAASIKTLATEWTLTVGQ
jgi:putative spermidine/putrescine transport system substrate-binding protein